jgi:HlyD family secretion protein
MNKKRTIPAVLLLALGGFLLWRFVLSTGGPANTLLLSGNIELTEVDMSFKLPGRLIELAVDEGDNVKAGQIVARMDSAELQAQQERENAGVQSAQSALVQLRTAIDWQSETLSGDIDLKRADLAAAQSRLRELETGSRPQEIENARAALDQARAENDLAQRDWARAQKLMQAEDISTAQFDSFRARAQAAAAALRRAEETYALVKEGPRRESIDQARANVQRAQAALKLAEANRLDLERRRQEVALRQAEIERAQANARLFAVQLGDRAIASPADGVVLSRNAEPGEVLPAGASVLTLGDIDHPTVRCYINERDLGRVKIGQAASVTTDSFPGKTYKGRVSFISSEAEFTPKQIQTEEERVKLVYRIKVEIENPNRELKSNMPVDVRLELQ